MARVLVVALAAFLVAGLAPVAAGAAPSRAQPELPVTVENADGSTTTAPM